MNLPGGTELIIILVIILFIFGAKKVPEIARSLGKSSGEFKKGLSEGTQDDPKPASEAEAGSPADKKTD